MKMSAQTTRNKKAESPVAPHATRRGPFAMAAMALVAFAIIGVLLYYATRTYVVARAEDHIEEMLLQHKGVHHYIQQKARPELYSLMEEGQIPQDFYSPALFSSSYAVRSMHKYYNAERELAGLPRVYYKMAAINPRNPVNRADRQEEALIDRFNTNRDLKEYRDVVTIDGEKYLYVAIPFLENTEQCLRCHGDRTDAPEPLQAIYPGEGGFGEKLGQIRAIESIRAPLGREFALIPIVLTSGGAVGLGLMALLALNWRLREMVRARTKQIEQHTSELHTSELKYRSLMETAGDAIVVANAQTGIIVDANAQAERLFDRKRSEMLGLNQTILYPPTETGRCRMMFVDYADTTHPPIAECEVVDRHGKHIPVEINASIVQLGNEKLVQGIFRDISIRKQAEQELAEARSLLVAAVEQTPAGVLIADAPDVRIRMVNSAALGIRGSSSEALTDIPVGLHPRNWQTFYPDGTPYDPRDLPLSKAVLKGRTTVNEEVIIRRSNGEDRWVLANAAPVRNPAGDIVAGVVVFADITDRKYAEDEIHRLNEELEERVRRRTAQLEAVNDELEAFAYSVSHDLRTPLRSMDGFSQAILDDYSDKLDDTGKDFLHRIRNASRRMGQLIDDMLKLSRLTRSEMSYQQVDLSRIAEEIRRELQATNPERCVEWVITPGATAHGDARLLRIAMANLLGNAWKFTTGHERARIEFGLEERDSETIYYVKDDGAGFDMAYADKLFGAFQRLHGATEFAGTGVGLATVQRIINRHSGRIWAEAEVEKGATFYFTL